MQLSARASPLHNKEWTALPTLRHTHIKTLVFFLGFLGGFFPSSFDLPFLLPFGLGNLKAFINFGNACPLLIRLFDNIIRSSRMSESVVGFHPASKHSHCFYILAVGRH